MSFLKWPTGPADELTGQTNSVPNFTRWRVAAHNTARHRVKRPACRGRAGARRIPDHTALTSAAAVGEFALVCPAAWCMTLMAARRRRSVETERAVA